MDEMKYTTDQVTRLQNALERLTALAQLPNFVKALRYLLSWQAEPLVDRAWDLWLLPPSERGVSVAALHRCY
jgi:hypothetical protein